MRERRAMKPQDARNNGGRMGPEWQMKFNPSKCHVLKISRKQNPVEPNYVLMGNFLVSVTHHPYLGVELSRNFDWGQHVNNKVIKANQSLGFLRRNLSSCPEGVKEAAYKALVRPHVEYASSVWDPHLKKHVKQIEGVQKRAARFVKNCYTREPGTVTNLLNELNWIPLKVRRTISRLILFHKAIHGDGGLAFPGYVMKRSRHLRAAVCKYRPGVGKIKISKNPKKIQWTTLGTLVMKI